MSRKKGKSDVPQKGQFKCPSKWASQMSLKTGKSNVSPKGYTKYFSKKTGFIALISLVQFTWNFEILGSYHGYGIVDGIRSLQWTPHSNLYLTGTMSSGITGILYIIPAASVGVGQGLTLIDTGIWSGEKKGLFLPPIITTRYKPTYTPHPRLWQMVSLKLFIHNAL